jgi:uncharacterized protein YajQ (UPF0234 family)
VAKDHSFDIVSEVDFAEVTNAVEQTRKEVAQRYDFKGSEVTIEWNKADSLIILRVENDMRLRALNDILQMKLVKRKVSLKAIDAKEAEKATGGTLKQDIKVRNGIEMNKAKEIIKFIKQSKLKAQAQIQKDQIRVQSAKIDTLQEVMQSVKSEDFGINIDFINYR